MTTGGKPDSTYCADCGRGPDAPEAMFWIEPPPGRTEGDGKPFGLCVPCWDDIIAGALLTRIR